MTDMLAKRRRQSRQLANRTAHSFLKPKSKWWTQLCKALNQLEINPKMLNRPAVIFAEVLLDDLKNSIENLPDSLGVGIGVVRVDGDFHMMRANN